MPGSNEAGTIYGGVSGSASEETTIRGTPRNSAFRLPPFGLGRTSMKTVILNAQTEIREAVAMAVEVLNRQDLVALPTETVYGLAGDALQAEAVAKIFEAKDRPLFDPLIVHVENQRVAGQTYAVSEKPVTPTGKADGKVLARAVNHFISKIRLGAGLGYGRT